MKTTVITFALLFSVFVSGQNELDKLNGLWVLKNQYCSKLDRNFEVTEPYAFEFEFEFENDDYVCLFYKYLNYQPMENINGIQTTISTDIITASYKYFDYTNAEYVKVNHQFKIIKNTDKLLTLGVIDNETMCEPLVLEFEKATESESEKYYD